MLMRLWVFNRTRPFKLNKTLYKKKKKRILSLLTNSPKKLSNSNSTSAHYLVSLTRTNKAKVGRGWVASIATHYKKMTIWTTLKGPQIDQTRLPSSFSIMEGGITLMETKNSITSLHLTAMLPFKVQVNIKKLTKTKWMSIAFLATHSKLKKHLILTKCLSIHQISYSKKQPTDLISKVSQARLV